MSKKFGLLGYPLDHSLSKHLHTMLFSFKEIDKYSYDMFNISPDLFKKNCDNLFKLDGFNITAPYKTQIIPYLTSLSKSAKISKSVNLVEIINKKNYIGHNTDKYAFWKCIKKYGLTDPSLKTLLIGFGGTGKMIASTFDSINLNLTIAVRPSSLQKHKEFIYLNKLNNISLISIENISQSFNTIINATPIGSFPNIDACPIPKHIILKSNFVFDLIYNPTKTKLLEYAKNHNISHKNGIEMLVLQAVKSHEIWFNITYSQAQIDIAYLYIKKVLQNE